MRAVANYAFSAAKPTPGGAQSAFDRSVKQVERWLLAKGESAQIDDARYAITYTDGRTADLQTDIVEVDDGELRSFVLTESIQEGVFRTRLEVARQGAVAEVTCELSVSGDSPGVVPVRFDARCPAVLRKIIDQGGWAVGSLGLRSDPVTFDGSSGGRELIDLIWSQDRPLPLIVVSDHDGLLLHPRIDDRIAQDVSGLAIVAQIDRVASWTLTEERGRDWSCFNGAVRLYWPTPDVTGSPHDHPLWTQYRLLASTPSTQEAARRIRNALRRMILGQSAFSIRESGIASEVREREREREREEQEAQRDRAREAEDWEGLENSYAAQNERDANEIRALRREVSDLKDENRDLKVQLRNLTQALRHSGAADEVAPDEDSPPTTVSEAVEAARSRFSELLVFGSDVDGGVSDLRDEAGPPDKVLRYLEQLAEMTRLRKAGELGTDPILWLAAQGVDASAEGKTVRNSPTQMARRRWNDGRAQREFTLHLKPNESTSPDLCVRIYFDYDDDREKTIVGWVGRHP